MTALTSKRILALGCLVALAALVYVAAVAPFRAALASRDAQLVQLREWTARYRAAAAAIPELERELQAARAAVRADAAMLGGGQRSDAANQLQDRIAEVVAGAEGSLRSIRLLDPVEVDGFRRLGARVQLRASQSGLVTIALLLESGTPNLFVERLEVQAQHGEGPTTEEPMLDIVADLVGFTIGSPP